MSRKIFPPLLALISVSLSALITLGTYLINEVGWPLAWLRCDWREPSYVEMIQYQELWLNLFFWLAVILILLALFKKLGKYTFSMKKIVFFVVILLVLALDWAAMHDILKGEPNPNLESAFLFFSLPVFMIMAFLHRSSFLD